MQNRDLYLWYQSLEEKNLSNVCTVFRQRFSSNFQITDNDLSLFSKIKRVIQKSRLLTKKSKEEFMLLNFIPPISETNIQTFLLSTSPKKEKNLVNDLDHLKIENKTLKRKVEAVHNLKENYKNCYKQLNNLESGNKKLKSVIKTSNAEKLEFIRQSKQCKALYTTTNERLSALEKKFTTLKLKNKTNRIRNLNKKILYRDIKLEKQEKEIDALKAQFVSQSQTLNKEFNDLNQMLESSNTKDDILSQEKRNLQKKLCRLKNNLNKTKESISASSIEDLTFLQSEVKELGAKVESLNKENIYLNGLLKLLEDEEIVTFERGGYSNDIREVIMELLSLNVSMNKVNDVIKIVLKKLAKKTVSKLPSVDTISRFMSAALILAQIQVSEEMLDNVEKDTGNCLHGDGTTKYYRHYQNFQLTSKSGKMLSFGLSELASGDAGSTLSSLTETLDDICDVLDTKDKEKDFAKLICSFKTTMSDLGSINPLFNSKFKEMRELLLPKVIEH
ncbi:uncharacterized protein LOC100206568 [Hydra vulgaris]|uniref:uncharacterized protein LOC100206568 n=1 Tax=Hydra vulgaris TaxID=6087 RepID=UPI001F5E41F5|nr:uncharacterized protein LOC100206568 [Hydra vulgaris]